MPPPPWATPPQLEFLKKHLATYIELKAERTSKNSNRKMSDFLTLVTKEFRISWTEVECLVASKKLPDSVLNTPESTWSPDQVALVKNLGDGRRDKQQIKWWFRNTARTALGNQRAERRSSVVLASLVRPPKKRRVHKVVEKYQMMNRDKLRELMRPKLMKYQKKYGTASLEVLETQEGEVDWEDEEVNDGGENTEGNTDEADKEEEALDDAERERRKQMKTTKHFRSWLLKTRKSVAANAWKNETQEVKDEVLRAIEVEKAEMLEMLDNEKEGLERDADQRQLVISNLMSLLENTCHEIHRLSGWSTTVITGGPNPAAGDRITIQTVSYGETVETSLSFLKWYPNYKENINEQFVRWLYEVYPGTCNSVEEEAAVKSVDLMELSDNDLLSFDSADSVSAQPAIAPPASTSEWQGPYGDDSALFDDNIPVPGGGDHIPNTDLVLGEEQSHVQPTSSHHLDNNSRIDPALREEHSAILTTPAISTHILGAAPTTSDNELTAPDHIEGFYFPQNLYSATDNVRPQDNIIASGILESAVVAPGLGVIATSVISPPFVASDLLSHSPCASSVPSNVQLGPTIVTAPVVLPTPTIPMVPITIAAPTITAPVVLPLPLPTLAPSTPVSFPETRPPLKPLPVQKNSEQAREKKGGDKGEGGGQGQGRGRGRGRGRRGRGGRNTVTQNVDPTNPDQVAVVSRSVRQHVNAVNVSQRVQEPQGTYWTSSNPAGANPTVTFPAPPSEVSSSEPLSLTRSRREIQPKRFVDGTVVPSAGVLGGKRQAKPSGPERQASEVGQGIPSAKRKADTRTDREGQRKKTKK